jgi:carboxymethylenebutenolidase
MCDDATERELQKYLAEKRLKRRAFNVGVGATAAVLVIGCEDDPDPDPEVTADAGGKSPDAGAGGDAGSKLATKSSKVEIETEDGKINAFFVHPETGKHAGVIIWPDILGPRAAFETMATRLAEAGFAVVVTNQYYRTAQDPVLKDWSEFNDEGRAKLAPHIEAITPDGIKSDAAALVEWLDKQSAIDTGKKIGTAGYCMGGPYTFRTAASKPERVGAFASLHGGGLVTMEDDSPHLLLPMIKASALIAIAKNDDERTPDVKTELAEAAEEAKVEAEIEVYPAQHGWCAIDSAAYDEVQANKAWDRMVAIFNEAL